MVYLHSKSPTYVGHYLEGLETENAGVFNGHVVYFTTAGKCFGPFGRFFLVIWYIYPNLVCLYVILEYVIWQISLALMVQDSFLCLKRSKETKKKRICNLATLLIHTCIFYHSSPNYVSKLSQCRRRGVLYVIQGSVL
jgi:hypothetical protein